MPFNMNDPNLLIEINKSYIMSPEENNYDINISMDSIISEDFKSNLTMKMCM